MAYVVFIFGAQFYVSRNGWTGIFSGAIRAQYNYILASPTISAIFEVCMMTGVSIAVCSTILGLLMNAVSGSQSRD